MTLYSYRREFPLTYFDRCTLPKNNSLSVKGETGTEHALDLSLEKVVKPSEMGYSWSRDLHGLPQPVVKFQSALCRILPRKYGNVSLWDVSLETKLAALSVRKNRSESSLDLTKPTKAKLQRTIPVNQNEARFISCAHKLRQTINTSCYFWGGGPVVLSKWIGRGLNAEFLCIKTRPYSTKILPKALSWKDSKVARRLESLWRGKGKDPQFQNERLFKLLNEIDLWKAAYIKLTQSKGSSTPSFDDITIDWTTLSKLMWIKEQVTSGQYKMGITKRV